MVFIKKKKHLSAEELEAQQEKNKLGKLGIQDEFQMKGFELVQWMQNHREWVIGFIGVLVVSCLVVSGWVYSRYSMDEDASVAYVSAVEKMEQASSDKNDPKKLQTALAAFQVVTDGFNGTRLALLSWLQIGHISLELNNFDKAIQAYRFFLDGTSKKDSLKPLAYMGLFRAYEATKDQQRAFDILEELMRDFPDFTNDTVVWESARLAKELTKTEKARELAKNLLEQFPNSPYFKNAESLLANLPTGDSK